MSIKKDPIQIIGIVIIAIKKAAEIIGSIEWKGRFRKRTDEAIEALSQVNEIQQDAIENLNEVVQIQQDKIQTLKDRLDFQIRALDMLQVDTMGKLQNQINRLEAMISKL
jgi:hypothetical protein